MSNVVSLEDYKIAPFLQDAIDGFLRDNPDSDFQRGYLSALIVVYTEGLRRKVDGRILAAEKLLEFTA